MSIEAAAKAIYEVMPDTFTKREYRTTTVGKRSELVTYHELWDDACEETRARCRAQAIAAIRAIRDPSDAVAGAGGNEMLTSSASAAHGWRAMIDALIAEAKS